MELILTSREFGKKFGPATGKCLCTSCGRVFSSLRYFDQHRQGSYAGTDGMNTRRCVDPAEIGLELNDEGVWWDYERVQRARERFQSDERAA